MNPGGTQAVDAVIERLLAQGDASGRDPAGAPPFFPTSIPRAEGEALAGWIEREAARRTIEIGLGYGVSALFIGRALRAGPGSGTHVAMDPHQGTHFAGRGLQVLSEAGLTASVEFFEEESQVVLPKLLSEERVFDLALVDGNHRFDRVFLDLIFLGWLVKPGGILFVDDYQLPAVARAVSFGLTNLGWGTEEVSPDDEVHQWAVLRTSTEEDERSFDHFVEF